MQLTEEQRDQMQRAFEASSLYFNGETPTARVENWRVWVEAWKCALAAHSAGAQEPVAWRHKWTNDHAAEWAYKEAGPKTDELRIGIPGVLGPDSHRECWEPLYAQPQPMTDAARDAERYRHLRECNGGSLVIVQITGMGDDDQVVLTEGDADAAIDGEIERLDRAKGE